VTACRKNGFAAPMSRVSLSARPRTSRGFGPGYRRGARTGPGPPPARAGGRAGGPRSDRSDRV